MLAASVSASTAYQAWLRYEKLPAELADAYVQLCSKIYAAGNVAEDPVLRSAQEELLEGLQSMLGQKPELTDTAGDAALLAGTLDQPEIAGLIDKNEAAKVDEEGYLLRTVLTGGSRKLVIAGTTSKGVLYGVFHFLRILQTRGRIDTLSVIENPANKLRMINHWDNMDGSIERGYAGNSILFRNILHRRLNPVRDYARLMASVGMNAV